MKKILLVILFSIFLIGCSIANTPTSKTEEYLGKYQRLDNDITIDYYILSNDNNISEEIKEEYNDLIKEQYQDLSYEIKEEVVDGDKATVTTSIKVKNYKDTIEKYNKNEYTAEEYHNLIINDLKETKDKVTYTIDFTLTKDDNDNWTIDDITNETKEKLLGIN